MRDLRHFQILVKVYYTHNGFKISQDDVLFFIDETEPDVFEAETLELLPFEPSCLASDVKAAMEENHIHGYLVPQIDHVVASENYSHA